jgi:hypothetical protein
MITNGGRKVFKKLPKNDSLSTFLDTSKKLKNWIILRVEKMAAGVERNRTIAIPMKLNMNFLKKYTPLAPPIFLHIMSIGSPASLIMRVKSFSL